MTPRGRIPDAWDWSDRPCYVVGTGPSLRGVPLGALHEAGRVVAVKEAAFLPGLQPDAVVGADWRWPLRRYGELGELAGRVPVFLAVEDSWDHPVPEGATLLRRLPYAPGNPGHQTFSHDRGAVAFGATSGYAALNFAALCGAKHISLLGFDYSHAPDGEHHAEPGRYPWYRAALHSNARMLEAWAADFDGIGAALAMVGATVMNCSPGSNIRAFPQGAPPQCPPAAPSTSAMTPAR